MQRWEKTENMHELLRLLRAPNAICFVQIIEWKCHKWITIIFLSFSEKKMLSYFEILTYGSVKTKGRNLSLLATYFLFFPQKIISLSTGKWTLTPHASLSITLLSVKRTIVRSYAVIFSSAPGTNRETEKVKVQYHTWAGSRRVYFSIKRENLISLLENTDSERAAKMCTTNQQLINLRPAAHRDWEIVFTGGALKRGQGVCSCQHVKLTPHKCCLTQINIILPPTSQQTMSISSTTLFATSPLLWWINGLKVHKLQSHENFVYFLLWFFAIIKTW